MILTKQTAWQLFVLSCLPVLTTLAYFGLIELTYMSRLFIAFATSASLHQLSMPFILDYIPEHWFPVTFIASMTIITFATLKLLAKLI